ncbi:unnamed protein product [Orchesella dallaii]|uniref:Uncharacterized protein n=1 Tax=Orchesella dallaii TaxID=48710 RepID=A0ABP1R7I2_9HEXA
MNRTSSSVHSTTTNSFTNQLPKVIFPSPKYETWRKEAACKNPEPPLFGNYQRSPKHQNQSSSSRHQLGACGRWPSIPAGTDVCFKPVSKRFSTYQQQDKQSPNSTLPSKQYQSPTETLCGSSSSSSSSWLAKKQYFNLMWDPHIARGPNFFQFTTFQRAKCGRQLELNSNKIFRHRLRRNFLDHKNNISSSSHNHSTKTNHPGQGTIYPKVKIDKEPLSYQSFIPFLTDVNEITKKDQSQSMNDDWPSCCAARVAEPKFKFSEGIHSCLQTDTTACKQDTSKWIVDNLLEKVPQQAILELTEESELEAIKGERQRHEMVLLYTKFQKIKEDQWQDYLQAWNEMRMKEIAEEDTFLQEQGDGRVCAVNFAKNAMKCCFTQTFDVMKADGYICQEGVPYLELKDVERIMENRKQTRKELQNKYQLSKNIVDSVIVKSVVTRFAQHMNDDFGLPHGRWLSTDAAGVRDKDNDSNGYYDDHHRRLPIEYDNELKSYLVGRNKLRRESIRGTVGVRSDTSLFNIFRTSLQEQGAEGGRLVSEKNTSFDMPRLQKLFQPRMKSMVGFGNTLGLPDDDGENGGGKSRENSFDVTLVYRRKTSWSKLEHNDEKLRQQQQQMRFGEEGEEEEKRDGDDRRRDKRDSGERGRGAPPRLSVGDKTQARRTTGKSSVDEDAPFSGSPRVEIELEVEVEDTDKLNEGGK